jgi:AraC-like DNA-binding protein
MIENIIGAGMFDSRINFPNIKVTQTRIVEGFALEYIISTGKESIAHINDKEYKLLPHTVLVRKPNEECYSRLHFKSYYIHFTVNKDSFLYSHLNSLLSYYPFIDNTKYKAIFEEFLLHYSHHTQNDCDLFLTAKILELVHHLKKEGEYNYLRENADGSADNRFLQIQDSITFMKKHFNSRLSLKQIAENSGYSPNHFRTVFASVMGKSPQKYLENLRVNHAKYLLATTSEPIIQIALLCGFSSQAYFTSVFKMTTLTTPNEYRAAQINRYKVFK